MKNWLQLFRMPNLLTVPGDPLAGYLLASAGAEKFRPAVFYAISASLLFYGFGLLLNDLMDFSEDCAERPDRPLPGGAVSARSVWKIAGALPILGLAICAVTGWKSFLFGLGIVLAVIAYDCGLKKNPLTGPLTMGICRGLSLLLGAALSGAFPIAVIAAALLTILYIAAVTMLARRETSHPAIPPLIGSLIRALILIQAFFCAISGAGWPGWLAASALALVLWPASRMVGKRFYAS